MLSLLIITCGSYACNEYPKPENIDGLKKVLQLIWDQLPQEVINKAMLNFTKRLRACTNLGVDISNVF